MRSPMKSIACLIHGQAVFRIQSTTTLMTDITFGHQVTMKFT